MRNEVVTVLDLGSTKVVCLAASPNESDGMDLKAIAVADCAGMRRGVVANLEQVSRAIETALDRVRGMAEDAGSNLIVGITGQHLEGVNAQGFIPIYPRTRSITREDVLQVINHSRQLVIPQDREQIQALPREFRVDGERGVQRPIGMTGSKLEVVTHIVTGQTAHVQNVERAVSMAGAKVEQMVVQGLASGLGVLTPEELEMGAAVVDIGGGTTDVAIFSGGSIAFSVCIPVAGQLVTSDLSKLLKTSLEEAERLKVNHGYAIARGVSESDSVDVLQLGHSGSRPLQRRVLCELIESRMRELVKMVGQQIEKSGFGAIPGGLVLTGGGSLLPGTDVLFSDMLKQPRVRVAEPSVSGIFEGAVDRPGLATALGLARFAIQCGEDEFVPVGGAGNWKNRIRTFWSLLGAGSSRK